MSRWYIDSSASLKVIKEEAESDALTTFIDSHQPLLVGCWLLETEMRRAVHRDPALSQDLVSEFLGRLDLYELPVGSFRSAGLLPGTHLRSLDALHLAAAVSIGVDAVLTYDERMAASARDLGLRVLSPR
jgi:predicted nucleic acid-binding protein